MKIAPSYVSALAMILATFLPDIDAPFVETTLNGVIILAGAIIVAVRQVLNGRSTVLGARPQ
jgi:hypothetical protein